MMNLSVEEIWRWMEELKDPEIPVLSLRDMGIIREIEVHGQDVSVTITPTFVGCPALEMIKSDIRELLRSRGSKNVSVNVSYKEPWTSEMISAEGRQALKKFGLAPPAEGVFTDLEILEYATCPRCDGKNTELKTPFGPTLCRSIHYCHDCKEAFEQFKPV